MENISNCLQEFPRQRSLRKFPQVASIFGFIDVALLILRETRKEWLGWMPCYIVEGLGYGPAPIPSMVVLSRQTRLCLSERVSRYTSTNKNKELNMAHQLTFRGSSQAIKGQVCLPNDLKNLETLLVGSCSLRHTTVSGPVLTIDTTRRQWHACHAKLYLPLRKPHRSGFPPPPVRPEWRGVSCAQLPRTLVSLKTKPWMIET
jgi:hypothetical protein